MSADTIWLCLRCRTEYPLGHEGVCEKCGGYNFAKAIADTKRPQVGFHPPKRYIFDEYDMTVRDRFICAALTGLLAGPNPYRVLTVEDIAKEALQYADAVMAAREAKHDPEV